MINLERSVILDEIESAAILGKDGQIHKGRCHATILRQQPMGVLKGCEQGFVTRGGRFVDRVEGLKLALKYNQVVHKHGSKKELYSEDLLE